MRSRSVAMTGLLASVLIGATACAEAGGGGTGSAAAAQTAASLPAVSIPSTTLSGFKPATPGTLTVVTNLPGPGFWDGNGPDSMTGGYEYGMAQYMAKRLGLTLKIINVGWDALVAGQVHGFDLALSTINITPARAQVALFSIPYFSSDQGVLVQSGKTVTSANARSLKWGVQQASTSQDFLAGVLKPDAPVAVFQDQPSMFAALAARQIDAVLLDTVQVLAEAQQAKGALAVVGQYRTGGVYGALLPKNTPNLDLINLLIQEMQSNGELRLLSQKYLVPEFGKDPTTVPYLQP